jgi:hypothetical protein
VERVTIELVMLASIRVIVRVEEVAFDAVHLIAQLVALIHEARIGIDLPPVEPLKTITE